ncbi:MAG: type I restriction enzyme HsdR N-terminal domain-containing protein [Leptolyngbyaceae cyanobacterium bins.302]|nr:type I restriction enzyme HsdR N-terminal domain-containing protein [Leptolyngbyaceae cyanobacterium bins.302]
MPQTFAVTDVVTTVNQVETRFNLHRVSDLRFFSEWTEDLPALTEAEQQTLDRIQATYLYQRADGALAEGTVNLLLTSPLLYLAGLCDPPFKIRSEVPVKIEIEDGETALQRRIDILILQNQLWIVVVESKRTAFPCLDAIPQALAYMMATPNPALPSFGMVTNGDQFIFVKSVQMPSPEYDFSDGFSLYARRRNELWDVLQILKRLKSTIAR